VLDELLAPDFHAGWTDADIDGQIDRDGMRKLWQHPWSAFPDWHQTILDIIAGEDKVEVVGSQEGAYAGLAATGRQIQIKRADLYRVAKGKIVEAAWTMVDRLVPSWEELVRRHGGRSE
jgi:predicted ester cyclase